MSKKIIKQYRSTKSGKFVSKIFSDKHPCTAVGKMTKHSSINRPILNKKK